MSEINTCPCQSQKAYKECCAPFHHNEELPATAEQLMRSRYCAFVLHNAAYLIDTLHPDYRHADEKASLLSLFEQTQWLGLKIIRHKTNKLNAEVEFSAFYQDADEVAQLHEKSRFTQVEGKWLYQDGEQLGPISIGRNDSCFCGSGKKYKKCHAS